MAHYAVLDENNVVIEVLTGIDEDNLEELPEGFTDTESYYSSIKDGKTVKRTSYNTREGVHLNGKTPFRGNYAGKGYIYLEEEDIFLPPKQHDYFVKDVENHTWIPPIPKPDEENNYGWVDELYQADNTTGWELIPRPE